MSEVEIDVIESSESVRLRDLDKQQRIDLVETLLNIDPTRYNRAIVELINEGLDEMTEYDNLRLDTNISEIIIRKIINLAAGSIVPIITWEPDRHTMQLKPEMPVMCQLRIKDRSIDFMADTSTTIHITGLIANKYQFEDPNNGRLVPDQTLEQIRKLGRLSYRTALLLADWLLTQNPPHDKIEVTEQKKLMELYNYYLVPKLLMYESKLYELLDIGIDPADSSLAEFMTDKIKPLPISDYYKRKSKILEQLEVTLGIKYPSCSESATKLELANQRLYTHVELADQKSIDTVLKELDVIKVRAKMINKIRQITNEEQYNSGIYQDIISKFFGDPRLKQILEQLGKGQSSISILAQLTPAEKEKVLLEYNRRVKAIEATISNKCVHKKIISKFRAAVSNTEVRETFHKILEYMPASSGNPKDIYKCKLCNFDLICPHLKVKTEMELAGKKYAELRAKMSEFISDVPNGGNYTCRICSEVIADVEVYSEMTTKDDVNNYATMPDELRQQIWSEVTVMVGMFRLKSLINVQKLVNSVITECYGHIQEVERQLSKSRTNTTDELKTKKQLFMSIYVIAYFLALITTMKRGPKEKQNDIEFRDMDPSPNILQYLNHAVSKIISTRSVLISKLPEVSNDFIKAKLLEAYKLLVVGSRTQIEYTDPYEEMFLEVATDPFYNFLYVVNLVAGTGIKTPKVANGVPSSIDYIEQLCPDLIMKMNTRNKAKLNIVLNGKLEFTKNAPPNIVESWDLVKAYFETNQQDILLSQAADQRAEHNKRLQKILDREAQESFEYVHQKRKLLYSAPKIHKPIQVPEVKLCEIFDESGIRHKWDILVGADGKDYKLTEFRPGMEGRPKIVDKKASNTGAIMSQVSKQFDNNKVQDVIMFKSTVDNFFKFYENRCLRGGQHEIENAECKKCHLKMSFIGNTESREAQIFFRANKAKFDAENNELDEHMESIRLNPSEDSSNRFKSKLDKNRYPEFDKYTLSFGIIGNLATKLNVPVQALSCLGATEKVEYNAVISGAYIPTEPEDKFSQRAMLIDSYTRQVLIGYSILRNLSRIVKLPYDIVYLLESSNVSKLDYGKITGPTPATISNGYQNKFRWFLKNKKPREIVDFAKQSFCEICSEIYLVKSTSGVFQKYIKEIVGRILNDEKLCTTSHIVSMRMLYKEIATAEDTEKYDSNYDDELGLGVDSEETIMAESKDEDSNDAMNMDNFDVDIDSSDSEETGNAIHVETMTGVE